MIFNINIQYKYKGTCMSRDYMEKSHGDAFCQTEEKEFLFYDWSGLIIRSNPVTEDWSYFSLSVFEGLKWDVFMEKADM